ncbi:MAG: FG-GAP repeat protein [Planctomycetota bacterium]
MLILISKGLALFLAILVTGITGKAGVTKCTDKGIFAAGPPSSPDSSGDRIPSGLSESDWSSIRAAYEAGRYSAFAAEDGLCARNPGQQWTTHFDGSGFLTKPEAGNWTWGLELRSYGAEGELTLITNKSAVSADGQHVFYKWSTHITEWYKNDSRGLEHGYTVWSRPAQSRGLLTFKMSVLGDLQPQVQSSSRDVAFVNKKGVPVLNYSNLTVFDARGTIMPARFESSGNELCILVNDSGAQYPITIDPVAQQAYLKPSNTDASDEFGLAVAVSGNTVVVGATAEDSAATGVNGNQTNNTANSAGAAYVFVRTGSTWSQQAYLKASNTDADDLFGWSVAISGDTAVIGAPRENSAATGINGDQTNNTAPDAGAAFVFVRSGTTWSQQAYLKASNTEALDEFGTSVAVSGDTVVIGAWGEDSAATGVNGTEASNAAVESGAAYIFVRSSTTWSQQAYLKASNTESDDLFGFAVSVSGNTIVVTSWGEDSAATGVNGNQSDNSASFSGAAYVFVRNGIAWSQQAYLKASNTDALDLFGYYSVSVSGDTIVVGASGESSGSTGVNGNQSDNSAAFSGAAYVFVRTGTDWSQQAYLKASNTAADDGFGTVVSVSGNTIIVGAEAEDSNATGVDGNQSSNAASNSGAAYVFVRNGNSWSQHAYLKASNTDSGDAFGFSVAVSGDVVIVGAVREDSRATGVNGDGTNNSAVEAGAAYMFDLDMNPGTSSYGTGTPGCTGTQTLGVNHAPMINSPHFALTCSNAPPSSLGLAIVTDSQDLAGSDSLGVGVLVHTDFAFATELIALDFASDGTGYSETVGATIPNNPTIVGNTYYACALWAWSPSTCVLPGFNPYNLSTSRGLAITILVP